MTSMTTRAAAGPRPAPHLNWRVIAGLTGAAAGATIVTGAFLPWVETFAGLIRIPGIRGGNGRILAAAGVLIAAAGLYHVIRGGRRSRWLVGVAGFAALGFSGYLLIQLADHDEDLGGDSMVLASGGPGLWVIAGGSLAAFGTLFLPASTTPPAASRRGQAAGWRSRPGDAARHRGPDRRPAVQGLRRGLQIALGLVWLLDAALQFQPYMFGQAFVSQVLMPAATGSPAAVASPALWADRLIAARRARLERRVRRSSSWPLPLGLLWRPAVKAALAGSVAVVAGGVVARRGLGGVLTGTASPVTGAPGAVILYALIAVLVWPGAPAPAASAAAAWLRPRACSAAAGAEAAWLVLWGSFALPHPAARGPGAAQPARRDLAATRQASLAGWRRWTAAPRPRPGSHGLAVSVVLAAAFVLIAAGVLFPATARAGPAPRRDGRRWPSG